MQGVGAYSPVKNQIFKGKDGYNNSSNPNPKLRKFAIGAFSLIVPGSGQIINGETNRGIIFFLASITNFLLCFKVLKAKLLGAIIRIGIGAYAAYDAYKKA